MSVSTAAEAAWPARNLDQITLRSESPIDSTRADTALAAAAALGIGTLKL